MTSARRFADALIAKQQQGVQVNLIHDSVGTLGTPEEFFQRLRDNGIRTLQFNPVNPATAKAGWDLNQRDHRKLLIVDGRTVFLGGINISSVYSGGSSAGRRSRGPMASHPGGIPTCRSTVPWSRSSRNCSWPPGSRKRVSRWPSGTSIRQLQPQGKEVVRAIGSSPDDEFSQFYVTLLSAIASAETEIWLTNAYFVPDPQLLAALKSAKARGVDVRMVLPGRTDSALVFHASRSYYDQLLQDGVICSSAASRSCMRRPP